jgi:hypothetical protein
MKRVFFMALAVFAAAALPTYAAPGNSVEKITGEVWFMVGDRSAYASFDLHEGNENRDPKGTFFYLDIDPNTYAIRYFVAEATCVNVRNRASDGEATPWATFVGDVVLTNHRAWFGGIAQGFFHDGGTPGNGTDWITGVVFDDSGQTDCGSTYPVEDFGLAWRDVLGGNLVIHPRPPHPPSP